MASNDHELTWARRRMAMDEWDLSSRLGYRSAERTAKWVLAREARPHPLSATQDEADAWLSQIRETLDRAFQ